MNKKYPTSCLSCFGWENPISPATKIPRKDKRRLHVTMKIAVNAIMNLTTVKA
jgi:hypothetical protein